MRGLSCAAMAWARSSVPPLSRYAVMPVARKVWQLASPSPTVLTRRLIIRNTSTRLIRRAPATAALAVAAVRFRAKLAGQPAPAGEATARVLGGFRRTAADRGRGQAAPLRADGLAAILATAERPRTDGRGVESHTTAHRRGRLDAVIASLLFMGGLRRSEVSALEWRDVSDARDGDGVLLTVRTSKTNQEGDAADVRYLKNGAAKAIRTLRADRPDAAPTDRVIGLSPLQIQRRFTAAARAAGIEARVTAHSGRVGLASELTARGASTTEVMLAGNWKTARMVAHYSAGATAERGAVKSICKGGDGGTARQHYGINRASLRDEFPLAGDRVPHRRTTATPQHAGAWSLQGVTVRRGQVELRRQMRVRTRCSRDTEAGPGPLRADDRQRRSGRAGGEANGRGDRADGRFRAADRCGLQRAGPGNQKRDSALESLDVLHGRCARRNHRGTRGVGDSSCRPVRGESSMVELEA